jgi:hypothetical protein
MNIISWVTGILKIKGDTDGTKIGNVGDSLKVVIPEETPGYVKFDHHTTDVFGRLTVAQDWPLWSHSHTYHADPGDYFDEVASSTGTFVHNSTTAMLDITNSTGSGDSVELRTYRYFEYLKGREHTFMFTANPGGAETDVVKQFGAFDDKNGLFFELAGTSVSVVKRSSTTGSTVDTKYVQSSWNHDKLDGTGSSGITIDWSTVNLFYIKYSWLGTNIVEWGIYAAGERIPCHRQSYSNSLTSLYMQSGNLPYGFRLENSAAVGTAPKFHLGCLAVFSGGTPDSVGEVFDVNTGTTELTVGTTEIVVAAIRLNPSTNRASLRPENFALISPSGNSTVFYKISIGTTYTGDTWASIPNSIAQGMTGYTTFTEGRVIQSGYIKAGGESVNLTKILSDLYVGRDMAGSSQTLSIVARTVSSNAKLLFSGRYREYK